MNRKSLSYLILAALLAVIFVFTTGFASQTEYEPATRVGEPFQTQPLPSLAEVPKTVETDVTATSSTPVLDPTTSVTTTVPFVGPPTAPGDCALWADAFRFYGADEATVSFFFGLNGGTNIIFRETNCGLDTLNEATGDSGICQINPIHNRAGYFGGVYFGDGGWLGNLHNLYTRQNTDSHIWIPACLTLYQVCGTKPWQPPYGCANRSLEG